MKSLRIVVAASLIGLAAAGVCAQPGAGKGPGPQGMGPAASAPGMGMGMGMRPGSPRGIARWGADYTAGWSMMTEQERREHRTRMRSMKTYEECTAYQAQHHEQMAARAKERGGKMPGQPRRDACAGLKR